MPTYEFHCNPCNETREIFMSMKEADQREYDGSIVCDTCMRPISRVPVVPLQSHLYGDPSGYHKPSPLKRFNTKTVSQKRGNNGAIG